MPATPLKALKLDFVGEDGLDYGGLAREWFSLLSTEIFNPTLGMFEYSNENDYSLRINANSAMEPDHLLYFQFVGRFMGLAALHGHFLDAAFTTVLCKRILGKPFTIGDLQEADPTVHRSMIWMLENDVTEVPDLTFSTDIEVMGEMVTHNLIPNGENIAVTEANKHGFVEQMVGWQLSRNTEAQLAALCGGLYEIIPKADFADFTARELLFMLCGTRTLDADDWKESTVYERCNASTDVVQFFWEIVEESTEQERTDLLQFCTGSTRVPVEGFQSLQGSDGPRRFCVQLVDDVTRLPHAHTCFNRLDLPKYPTKERLKQRLQLAVDGAEGFSGD